jgi:lysozyme
MGDTCTQEQADAWLEQEIDEAAQQVEALVTVSLTQGQLDALTDFTFELGSGRLEASTLLHLLNRGDYGAAGAQLKYWVMAGGQQEPGMVIRRAKDLELWQS